VLQERVGKPIILAIIVKETLNRFNLQSDLLADNGQFCFQKDLAEK
jgi:glycerol-3-phosphate O-acyltransferase